MTRHRSDFTGTVTGAAFQTGDSACSGYLGWTGSCGYPSLGHTGPNSGSGADFVHACSRTGTYYCSADHMNGPASGSTFCWFRRKWYWIK